VNEFRDMPADAAGRVAHAFGWDRIVIIGIRDGADGGQVVTYAGRGARHEAIAADMAKYVREKLFGWESEVETDIDKLAREAMREGPDDNPNLGKSLLTLDRDKR
jgi:hypothetical protein